jgi:molybdopterin synthase sulfur carrier subunit
VADAVATVTVRYFAGARAAAGVEQEQAHVSSVGELLTQLSERRGDRFARTLAACSFLVNGQNARDHSAPLPDHATVDVLPPFAGG